MSATALALAKEAGADLVKQFPNIAPFRGVVQALIALNYQGVEHANALEQRIEQLEREVTALRLQKGMSYRGTWERGLLFHPGEIVTDKGSAWYCHRKTHDRPGETDCWQLMVKKGADAR